LGYQTGRTTSSEQQTGGGQGSLGESVEDAGKTRSGVGRDGGESKGRGPRFVCFFVGKFKGKRTEVTGKEKRHFSRSCEEDSWRILTAEPTQGTGNPADTGKEKTRKDMKRGT